MQSAHAGTPGRCKVLRPLMLSFYYSPHYSGSAVQAENLCKNLQRLGIEPMVASANLTGSARAESVAGIPVRRLRVLRPRILQVVSFSISLAWFAIRNRYSFDLFHAHGTLQHVFASALGWMLGKPSILKIAMADSDIAFERQGRLWGLVNRFLVRRFDRFIATSAEIERELLETGIAASRIRRLPNGVDHRKFQPVADAAERDALRKQLRLPPGPIVCFVGIIDARKNVDGALRIFQRARSTAGCGHFVLIGPQPLTESGEPTAYARELSEFVAENGLADHVSFTGQRTEVAEYLRAANVFLFPSRREGMPNVVLEAMASGLPCVASRIGGAVDLIEDGTTGFLHDVDNEADFAESLAALLTDAGLAARCGAAARAHVEANLSLEQLAERYAALYAELVAPTGSGKRA